MAQENNSDFSSKFSTLNVNAMEFVPSFCTSSPPTAAADDVTDTPNEGTSTPEAQTPEDVSPTKTEEEPQPVTVAAPTEPINDKSPG